MRPRVLLADDHRIVSEGLRSLLADDFEFVGIVDDGRALVAAAKKLLPDVIVADISMPYLDGIAATALLKKENSDVKIVLLTMHDDPAYARRALKAGANGFVAKCSAASELIMAIQAALEGRTFVSPALVGDLLKQPHRKIAEHELTRRQREILILLTDGFTSKEIAARLAISKRTVEFHKYHMMESHELHNNAKLIRFAIKQGIVAL